MKTTLHHLTTRLAAGALALLIAASTASAALRTYTATWSGAPSNTATATATFVLDDTVFNNPGIDITLFGQSDQTIISLTVTVSGASSGNGTFNMADFTEVTIQSDDALPLDAEWVGTPQPSSSSGSPWGSDPNALDSGFTLLTDLGSGSTAPYGFYFELVADNGGGDRMFLTSIAPFVEPMTNPELSTGDAILNVTDATVKTLYTPAVDEDGNIVVRAKMEGTGITSANDDCILRWKATTGEVYALAIEGGSLGGGTIKAFGEPVVNPDGSNYACKATLLQVAPIDKTNDTLILVGATSVLDAYDGTLQEGSTPPGVATRKVTSYNWLHWAGNALFVGANAKDALLSPATFAGVWAYYYTSSGLTSVVQPGDATTVDGVAAVVKTIYKPTAGKPSAAQTRVGNAAGISLYLKTEDGKSVIKHFPVPPASS